MRHTLLILSLILGLCACNDNKNGTQPTGSPEKMSFEPMTGGAVMHYTLPADTDVVGINVRYRNAFGQDVLRTGSSACDSLTLIGFKEAQSGISAQVTLCYYNGQESEPVDVTFDTADSGPVAFIKNVDCHANWGGFSLSYDIPEGATGMAHVFYLGTDPVSQRPDTIWISSFYLEETKEPGFTSYKMQQDVAASTIVVRVEDFLGYMVAEKSWANVENIAMSKLDKSNFKFYCDNSQEDATYKFGVEYLFDGDTKGESCFTDNKFHTFLAGPDAAGPNAHPMYLDMKENRLVASVRLYSIFKVNAGLSWYNQGVAALCKTYNDNEIPCEATIYGLKDNGATPSSYTDVHSLGGWVKIGSFKQDKDLANSERWSKRSWIYGDYTMGMTLDALKQAEPEYVDVVMPAYGQGEGYRYIKIVFNEVFNNTAYGTTYLNTDKYVTFHELEFYTN